MKLATHAGPSCLRPNPRLGIFKTVSPHAVAMAETRRQVMAQQEMLGLPYHSDPSSSSPEIPTPTTGNPFLNMSTSTKTYSTFRATANGGAIPKKNKNPVSAAAKRNEEQSKKDDPIVVESDPETTTFCSPDICRRVERLYGVPDAYRKGLLRVLKRPGLCSKKPSRKTHKDASTEPDPTAGPSASELTQTVTEIAKAVAAAKAAEVASDVATDLLKMSLASAGLPAARSSEMKGVNADVSSSDTSTDDSHLASYMRSREISEETTSGTSAVMDGHYFSRVLNEEIRKLEQRCSIIEEDLQNIENLEEEVSGMLRAASGQGRLFVSQKLAQFKGLCDMNMQTPQDEFITTNEDLQGFWDMLSIQLNQLYSHYDEIDNLRRNGWTLPKTQATSTTAKSRTRRKPAPKTSQQKVEEASSREEQRKKMLEERKRQAKILKELRKDEDNDSAGGVEFFAK